MKRIRKFGYKTKQSQLNWIQWYGGWMILLWKCENGKSLLTLKLRLDYIHVYFYIYIFINEGWNVALYSQRHTHLVAINLVTHQYTVQRQESFCFQSIKLHRNINNFTRTFLTHLSIYLISYFITTCKTENSPSFQNKRCSFPNLIYTSSFSETIQNYLFCIFFLLAVRCVYHL